MSRHLDAALLDVGFAASRDPLDPIAGLEPGMAMDGATKVIAAVRELVGDHVQHNANYIGFPEGLPAAMHFWVSCLRAALGVKRRSRFRRQVLRPDRWICWLRCGMAAASTVRL